MINNILISIIIPVLNNRHGFSTSLLSITKQSTHNIEVIVIDGGSTDGTLLVIDSFSDYITYFETGLDSGIADAFNRGIAHANGDIIGILNSDDALDHNALKYLISAFEKIPTADIYYGAIRYYDPLHKTIYTRHPSLSSMYKRMSIFHPSISIRRSCYEKIGGYDCHYTHAMDSEWCHRAIAAKMKFHEIPAVLATMSLGGISDIEYNQSLKQYRNSVIHHKLANPVQAYFYYFFYLTIKAVMHFPFMRPIKLLRDRFIERKNKNGLF